MKRLVYARRAGLATSPTEPVPVAVMGADDGGMVIARYMPMSQIVNLVK